MANDTIHSIHRALDIIEILAAEPKGLGISEMAKRLDMAKSTAYRIASTLCERKYLTKTERGHYKIGPRLIESVSLYIGELELQTEARPYIGQISNELGLTAHLGILDGVEVIYVERLDYFSSNRQYINVGIRVPAHSCSLGKCLLANFAPHRVREIFKDVTMKKNTEHTISDVDELLRDLDNVRRRGYALDNEESMTGHRCLGVPVYDYRGDIIAAISASGSTTIFPEDKILKVAAYMKEKGLLLSKSLGYIG